jgi:acetyltransferase-like isoleucine patch superfamily enzyme
VTINKNVTIDFTGDIEIHKNCFISESVHIYTHTHDHDPRSKPTGSKLVIRESSWIGAYSIILSNCTSIGPNSIIAIRTLATKDVQADTIFKNQI